MHYPGSNHFEPYQVITHFFMHGDFMHILFNMIGLIVFGTQLERYWGKKRFFIFYFVTALGAAALHFLVQGIEIYNISGEWFPNLVIDTPPGQFVQSISYTGIDGLSLEQNNSIVRYYYGTVVGASGAVYGLLMAFALLFPNTEFRLLFPPVTLKAKWLALIMGGIALYSAYQDSGDSIAHFAHLGGMLFGFIMIQIWKRDKSNFY